MPVFVSTACLRGTSPLVERVEAYSAAGLRRIELGAGVTVRPGDLTKLAKTDCQWLIHNYFPPPAESFVLNLASPDVSVQRRSLELVAAALAYSSSLGAPLYSAHGGFVVDPVGFGGTSFTFPPSDQTDAIRAAERFNGALTQAIEIAAASRVSLLVENNVCTPALKGSLLLQTPTEFVALFRRIQSPWCGILLDVGHLNVSATTVGFDPISFVDALSPHIRAFHVHDNDGTADQHHPVTSGSWILDVLRRPAFHGAPVVIEAEFPSVGALADHAAWLSAELE